jgi:hypothetical protein
VHAARQLRQRVVQQRRDELHASEYRSKGRQRKAAADALTWRGIEMCISAAAAPG